MSGASGYRLSIIAAAADIGEFAGERLCFVMETGRASWPPRTTDSQPHSRKTGVGRVRTGRQDRVPRTEEE
jgi:hypothetical protein